MPKDNGVPMITQTYRAAVPLTDLTPHPANPNEGDVGLVGSLFAFNGFGGAILVQKSTGIIIDGETRWRAAKDKGMKTIPVIFADVDDDTRDRLLASWNEAGRVGRNDETKMLALLTGLRETPLGLDGTAHDGDDIDDLLYKLRGNEDPEEPEGGSGGGTGASLVEMVLRFYPEALEEVTHQLDDIRGLTDPNWSAEDIVLTALRVTNCVLNDQPDQAAQVAKGERMP